MTFATYFNEKLNIFLVNLDFLAKYVGFAVVFHLVKLPKRGLFLLFLAVFGLLHGAGAAFYHAAALEHISNAMQKDFCIVQESDVSGILTVIAGFHINRQLIAAIDLGQTGQTGADVIGVHGIARGDQVILIYSAGRGPMMDICPATMLYICGSSSRLVRRRNAPLLVI